MIERERFGGKKMENEWREAGWTNKYEGCHLESRGDGDEGSRFLLPSIPKVERETVLQMMTTHLSFFGVPAAVG
jgi:hypothetical protein